VVQFEIRFTAAETPKSAERGAQRERERERIDLFFSAPPLSVSSPVCCDEGFR